MISLVGCLLLLEKRWVYSVGIVDNIGVLSVSYRKGVCNIGFSRYIVSVSVMKEISVIFDIFAYFFYLLHLISSLITSLIVHIH